MSHRYLVAYIGDDKPDCRALLRFPPGVTLEDAEYDWLPILRRVYEPTLPRKTVERLRGLGVEIAAASPEALIEAFWRGAAPLSSIGDFAGDYLGVNDRLGGKRCVSIEEYAMHTYIKDQPLRDILRDYLHQMDDVRLYGDVAFRTRSLPDILRLRVQNIVFDELNGLTPIFMPCGLHGDQCRLYTPDVADAIYVYVDKRYLGERVGVRRRLLDAAKNDGDPRRVARVLLAVVRRVLYALPKGAVSWNRSVSRGLASLVAFTVAKTCEEHAMLAKALRRCGSVREMVRRAREYGRDPSWVVSRALEDLRDE